jgi:raffinose/stachyose/melibiose transport system substrate-binding protein
MERELGSDVALAEAYNAQSELYTIVYEDALSGLDFLTEGVQKIRLAYENQEGPDIVGSVASGAQVAALVESGEVQDLTQAYKERGWDKLIPQSLFADVTLDGKIYAVPTNIQTVGMFYNKDIFEELSLEVPSTWDEFITVLEAIKDAGYYPNALGLAKGWPSAFQAAQYGYISGGSNYRDAMKGEILWTECTECLTALEWYYKIGTEYSNPDVVGIDRFQAEELFFAGEAAMVLHVSSLMVNFQDIDFEAGFFYIPPINPLTDITIFGGVGGNYVVGSSGNVEAAYDYIDWYLSDEGATKALELGKVIPTKKTYEVPTDIDPLLYDLAVSAQEEIDTLGTWPVVYMPGYLFSDYNQFIQGMMIGELTPAEVLEELQKDREKYDAEQ